MATWVSTMAARRGLLVPARARLRLMCSASKGAGSGAAEPSDASGGLPRPDIVGLAKLAKVELTDAQVRDFQPKVDRVVDWFAQLQEVEMDDAEVADFEVIDAAIAGTTPLRDDEPVEYAQRDALMSQFPATQDGYIKLPKTSAGQSDG